MRQQPADGVHALLPELAALPGHLLWRATARCTAALADVLPAGVDHVAYAALLALAGGATRSQQSLAGSIAVSRTTMVRVAADLAAQGLVERVRNPEDRRSYALTRTAEGAATARRWGRFVQEVEEALVAGFTEGERRELHDLLARLAERDLAEDTPAELRASVGFLVTRVQARFHRAFSRLLGPLGIEPRHFGSLVALSVIGPVSQGELGRHLGVSGPSTVQIVDELEERGLVERRRSESDRRTQVLHVHPAVGDLLDRAAVLVEGMHATELEPLTPAERERLVTLLHRFVLTA